MAKFPPDVLAAIAEREEVEIETGGRRTIIWIVAHGPHVFVRSVRGERGRWYRDLLADPNATLHFRGKPKLPPVKVRGVHAPDPESIAASTRALKAKYARDPALKSMLQPETLPTTVRLELR
ncbi:MAG: DUF2255 family protein [Chloroflexota bacterium]